MLGDHACAEGALAAGLDFFAGYPITPSTEVAERLAHRLPDAGGKFIQMEDEIASMAAIIGASAAGARSFTATSGPGLSLMMENIGLAAMMEVPCVIVDVMRASPSTGLPTMVGQSDVQMARWGSHGEYGVVAYAPASPQECFDLTIQAFNTADAYRMPVFILMDETLGHMTERVVIPDAADIPRVQRKTRGAAWNDPALPSDTLVPPMAHAGDGFKVHLTGLTHDERGYPLLTPTMHEKLVNRLVDKVRLHAELLVMVEEYALADAETVIVSFGCAARSARRAAVLARQQGLRVGMLRLKTLWPFPVAHIQNLIAAGTVRRFVVPEVNLGQVRREIERLTSLPVVGINHPGGAVMTPESILEGVRT